MNPDLPAGDPGAPMEERSLIKIFGSRTQADVAVSELEARGIECWTTTDDAGGMLPNLTAPGGVKLFVRKTDAEAAAALLDVPGVPGKFTGVKPASPNHVISTLATLFLGFVAGVGICVVYSALPASHKGTHVYYSSFGGGHNNKELIYENGYLSKVYKDRNGDGKWDYWAQYDKDGREESMSEDNNFDGKPDEFWYYTNEQPVRMQKDTYFSGVPDETVYYKNGLPAQTDWIPNGSTSITKRCLFTNAVLYQVLRDTAGHGYFDQQVIYNAFDDPIATNSVNLPITPSP